MQIKVDDALLVSDIGERYAPEIAQAAADLTAQGIPGRVGETRGFNVGGVVVTFLALPAAHVSTNDPIDPVVLGEIGWRVSSIVVSAP